MAVSIDGNVDGNIAIYTSMAVSMAVSINTWIALSGQFQSILSPILHKDINCNINRWHCSWQYRPSSILPLRYWSILQWRCQWHYQSILPSKLAWRCWWHRSILTWWCWLQYCHLYFHGVIDRYFHGGVDGSMCLPSIPIFFPSVASTNGGALFLMNLKMMVEVLSWKVGVYFFHWS